VRGRRVFRTEVLAEWAASVREIPPSTEDGVRLHLLDTIAAAVAGTTTDAARAVRAASADLWGRGGSPVWFGGESTTPMGAAFANAAAACAMDLDDGHRAAAGHPGAIVVPAVLAVAGEARAGDVLAAIAIGYEVGVRISSARDLRTVPTTNSGLWGGQAVAAAVGALRGLPVERIAHAIAIAGTTNPSQVATPYTRFRANNVKEGIPWAAANGIAAVALAGNGFTGPLDVLDHRTYDPAVIADGLGGSPWCVETAYLKPYSCCRWIHAPIDCLLEVMTEQGLCAEDVERLDVLTFDRTLTLSNEPAPSSIEGAQYSLPFCLGLAAARGADALLDIRPDALTDPSAIRVARGTSFAADPVLSATFPAATPGQVTVTTRGGHRFTRRATVARGDRDRPLTTADVEHKFRTLARGRLSPDAVTELLTAITTLRDGQDVRALLHALARNLQRAQEDLDVAGAGVVQVVEDGEGFV
jgi:2-methylcitrate dehydratase PrpD